jgi:hypothetical protein
MSSINTLKAGIETAPLLSMETYLRNLRILSANIALAMLVAGFILHSLKGPSQAFYLIGPYIGLAFAYWALARFGRFATVDLEVRQRIAESSDFGRHLLVDQIHAAHMLLIAGVSAAAAIALMSPYRPIPALFVLLTSACVELALLGRRRRVLVC